MTGPASIAETLADAASAWIADHRTRDDRASLDELTDAQWIDLAARALKQLHPFATTGAPYPGFVAPLANRSARAPRCALALSPRPLADPGDASTLFARLGATPHEAWWLEFEITAEWRHCEPNASYARSFERSSLRRVAQLATDESIVHAALVWILLASSETRAREDLAAWERLALSEGLPISTGAVRVVPIPEVQGNGCALIAVMPVGRS